MDYRISEQNQGLALTLEGRFTFLDYAKFKPVLDRLQTSAVAEVVVDLARLDFIDSTGLGLLVSANDLLKARGGQLRLVKSQGAVREVLVRAQFSRIMAVD